MRPSRCAAAVLLSCFALSHAACAEHTSSSLVGAMRLSIADGAGVEPLHVDGPPGKLRAQINDDGVSCSFWARVESEGGEDVVEINTYADEVEALIAGQRVEIAATSNQDRSITVNAATVLLRSDVTAFSTSGSVRIEALPAPTGLIQISLTAVRLAVFDGGGAERIVDGTIEATYVGVAVTSSDDARACAHLAEIPRGLVF